MSGTSGRPGGRQEAAARVVAGLGPVARLGVLEGGAEVEAAARRRRPPAALRGVGLDARGRLVPVVADRGQVGDGRPSADAAGDPVAARSLEHPRPAGVRDDEAVVVVPAAAVLGAAALAVTLEEVGDHPLGLVRRPAPLEAEAQEVHARGGPSRPASRACGGPRCRWRRRAR